MNTINLFESQAVPYAIALALVGLTALAGTARRYCLADRNPDLETIHRLAGEIVQQKLTIADADAYDFVATHKTYVDEHGSKHANLAMMAAGLRANSQKQKYSDSPEEIVRLGQDLLKKKAGQCDHMAASVIAKIVEHIRNGGAWSSDVELVGNGGHAFVIMNRQGELNNPRTWGKKAIIIDTWLGKLGVNPKNAHELSAGKDGVVSGRKEILANARFFGADRLKITRLFTSEELHSLAKKSVVKE
ncbi:MAG: hypothetical protein K1X28_10595 [Parachlamydiales bacterium]|nr:hypothetical protein [Parachlamydiales bacterium]